MWRGFTLGQTSASCALCVDPAPGYVIPEDLSTKCNIGSVIQPDPMTKFTSVYPPIMFWEYILGPKRSAMKMMVADNHPRKLWIQQDPTHILHPCAHTRTHAYTYARTQTRCQGAVERGVGTACLASRSYAVLVGCALRRYHHPCDTPFGPGRTAQAVTLRRGAADRPPRRGAADRPPRRSHQGPPDYLCTGRQSRSFATSSLCHGWCEFLHPSRKLRRRCHRACIIMLYKAGHWRNLLQIVFDIFIRLLEEWRKFLVRKLVRPVARGRPTELDGRRGGPTRRRATNDSIDAPFTGR